jgi:hypothetical protein
MSGVNAYGFWGPPEGIDTHDLLLYLDGDTPVSRPQKLIGHALTNPNVDQSDALTITRVKLSGGRVKVVVITKRAPEERGRQYTINFPSGTLWSAALEAALRPGCRKTAYIRYLCPTDRKYNYSDVLPDALFDPPQPAGDLITVDDVNPVSFTSVMRISEQFRIYELGYDLAYSDATVSLKFTSVAFLTADCPTCSDIPGLGFVVGGGDGAAAFYAKETDDRWATAPSALAVGAGVADYVNAWYNDGSLLIAGFADKDVITASASGGLAVSRDGGVTWGLVAAITVPIWGITRLGDTLLAVGGTAAGAPVLYSSEDNGKSWTASTSALITGTAAFLAVAADNDAGAAYIVGEGGLFIKVTISGSALVLSDYSANLDGAPGDLNTVCVLAQDFIAVGGAAGYYAESLDGGATSVQITVAGTDAIKRIAGNRWRTMVAALDALYDRSVLTNYEYELVALEGGAVVSGNYTDLQMRVGSGDDFNMFVAVTDAAEVVLGKSFLPNA